MNRRRVLIAGCGDLGTRIGGLLAIDSAVWGLKRNPAGLPGSIQPVAADLSQPDTLKDLPAVDQVVFCPTPGRRDETAYRRTFIDGLRNLTDALSGQPLSRLLIVSSTAVYGQTDGSWVDESSVCQPSRFNGVALLEMEQLAQQSGFPVVIARPSGLYGGANSRLLDNVRTGTAKVQRRPDYWTNRIHRDDAAAAIVHIMNLPEPQSVYLLTDECPATQAEVMDWLADQLAVTGLPEKTEAHSSNKRISSQRLRQSGFQFQYPNYRSGYGSVIAR